MDGKRLLAEAILLFTDMPSNLLNPAEAESKFGWRLCNYKEAE
jgi:hypothetical protein